MHATLPSSVRETKASSYDAAATAWPEREISETPGRPPKQILPVTDSKRSSRTYKGRTTSEMNAETFSRSSCTQKKALRIQNSCSPQWQCPRCSQPVQENFETTNKKCDASDVWNRTGKKHSDWGKRCFFFFVLGRGLSSWVTLLFKILSAALCQKRCSTCYVSFKWSPRNNTYSR